MTVAAAVGQLQAEGSQPWIEQLMSFVAIGTTGRPPPFLGRYGGALIGYLRVNVRAAMDTLFEPLFDKPMALSARPRDIAGMEH